MKDWNSNKDADDRADLWIAWEAALIGLMIVLAFFSVFYDHISALP